MKRFVAALLVGLLLPVLALAQTTGVPKPKLSSANFGNTTSSELRSVISDPTGSGSLYFQGGNLGTPSGGVLTNATGLPVSTGISGMGSGVATFLATPSSANLLAALTTKTGTGSAVFGDAPTIDTLTATGKLVQNYTDTSTDTRPVGATLTYTSTPSGAPVATTHLHGWELIHQTAGNNFNGNSQMYPLEVSGVYGGSGTMFQINGIMSNPTSNGGGTLTRANAFFARGQTFTASTITTAVGYSAQNWMLNGGTIGTLYGFKAEDMTAGTTNYAFYSGTGRVRFGDQTTITSATVADATTLSVTTSAGLTNAAVKFVSLTPTIAQGTTNAYTVLDINPTQTSTGSGTKRLIDARIDAGATVFNVDVSGNIFSANNITLGGGSALTWNTFSRIVSNFNGRHILQNNNGTSYDMLQFGGTTSSFPGIKRNSAALNFRLADDTADAAITAGAGVFSGSIASIGATAGIGYATGAGGTATQSTDKSATVVLSKATGQITMNAATLNANTAVSFTLTNTAIGTTDMVLCQHISGGTVGAYTVTCAPGSGSATVTVRNITGGNLGEAIVIQFTVIKAVTASNDNVPAGVELRRAA